jgi:DNA-binding NarL/FixJ family response regulator
VHRITAREALLNRPTVLIADDHPVWRLGLRQLLEPDFRVVCEVGEGGDALDQVLAQNPDVVVMDVCMPGMDGIAATRLIKQEKPKTGVVMVSTSDDDQQIFDAIQAGASAYVVKDDDMKTLLEAINSAAQGKAYLPTTIAKRVFTGIVNTLNGRDEPRERGSNGLSSRETAVLRLMGRGYRNRQIAAALFISERTVGNHITSIYNKLGISDRAHAVVFAIKRGIVRV